MQNLPAPKPLKISDGDVEGWKSFKQGFELYMIASGGERKDDKIKKATLLHLVGEEGRCVYNNFTGVTEQTTYAQLIEKFDEHFVGKKNKTFERHVLRNMRQAADQSFDAYVNQIRTQAGKCEFDNKLDENVIDQIITGVHSDPLREKLLAEVDPSLQKILDMCRAFENVTKQLREMSAHETKTVDAVQWKKRGNQRGTDQHQQPSVKKMIKDCNFCGYDHPVRKCPAYGKRCTKCDKIGHFRKKCKSRFGESSQRAPVHYMSSEDMDSHNSNIGNQDNFFVGTVEQVDSLKLNCVENQWTVNAKIGVRNQVVKFKLDTGSQVNILPNKVYARLTSKPLKTSTKKLIAYNNAPIKVLGEVALPISVQGVSEVRVLNFVIVNHESPPLLGISACTDLKLIQKLCAVETKEGDSQMQSADQDLMEIIEEYDDVFSGDLPGLLEPELNLKLMEGAIPKQHPPRRIPFALHDRVKTELQRMETEGVISKVTEPTEWINSMVVVEKSSGDLRICLDPRDLNKYMISDQFKIPTMEEMTSKLSDSKFFVKLDARSSFWQIKLSDESAKLTTFSTPFGNYCFNRLPFGLNVSSQVFQGTLSRWFADHDGVEVYIDDMLIHAPDKATLKLRLRSVLEICRQKLLKLNKEKCEFDVSEVKYLGVIINKDGQRVDPDRVSSIIKMSSPTSKEEVMRFLGMLTYVSNFIPNLSEQTTVLRDLLKKDSAFVWTAIQEGTFQKLKTLLTTAPVLKFFDPSKPIKISCDSSQFGLGATLIQEGHPISFASRSLTNAERNYSQIEKELLSIVFAVERFHQYVYGRKFVVENDHKPLKFLFCKPLACTPPRIERLMLRLERYDFEYEWIEGRQLFIADALSRSPQPHCVADESLHSELQYHVHMIKMSLPFSSEMLEKFKTAIEVDNEMSELKKAIFTGWSNDQFEVPVPLKKYWNIRDEFSVEDGLILKGNRLLIPQSWRQEMLKRVHEGHQGIDKCINRAKTCMFWIGMVNDIKQLVANCEVCQKYRPKQTKQPLLSHERPNSPWLKLGSDVFHFDGSDYLLIVDYHSNYPEVIQLRNLSSSETVLKMKSVLARHGIPETIITDNATNFASETFNEFCMEWGINHGLAERYVGIIKTLLKKAKEEGRDPYIALLNYRATPVLGSKSPTELLFGRKARTRLPVQRKDLRPQKQVGVALERTKTLHKQQHHFNKSARNLPELRANQNVTMWNENSKSWKPAVVAEKCSDIPRSYIVETTDAKYRRNRGQLRALPYPQAGDGQSVEVNRNPSSESPPVPAVPATRTRSGRTVTVPLRYR